jgi:hypothetical protein
MGIEGENKKKQNSNILIIIVSFLLMISIAVSVLALLNGNSKDTVVDGNGISENIGNIENEYSGESLGDMFQKEFLERSGDDGGYDFDDPFRETCASVDSDSPATTSFTVCQPH